MKSKAQLRPQTKQTTEVIAAVTAKAAEAESAPIPQTEQESPKFAFAADRVVTELAVDAIRLDGGTQSRAKLSKPTIAEYAEAMHAGAQFPPPVVFHDGEAHWLADGFHRVNAHREAGHTHVACEVRQGSQRDAILFGASANAGHGLRRTSADKRHAVDMLLRDAEWSGKTDRWIGDACGVGHQLVATRRRLLGDSSSSAPRVGKDGKVRKAPKRKKGRKAFDGARVAKAAPQALDRIAKQWPKAEPLKPLVDAVLAWVASRENTEAEAAQ